MIMKKVLMFMAIMIAVVSLSSCNSFEDKAKNSLENKAEDSFENKAKKQLHATMKEVARNPKTYKITNEKVIFSNDSMCTISFIGKGQNGFGGYSSSEKEYTLINIPNVDNGGAMYIEILLDMENQNERENSIKETIKDIDNGFYYDLQKDSLLKKTYDGLIKKGMSKKDAKDKCLLVQAMFNSLIYGREVDNNN